MGVPLFGLALDVYRGAWGALRAGVPLGSLWPVAFPTGSFLAVCGRFSGAFGAVSGGFGWWFPAGFGRVSVAFARACLRVRERLPGALRVRASRLPSLSLRFALPFVPACACDARSIACAGCANGILQKTFRPQTRLPSLFGLSLNRTSPKSC